MASFSGYERCRREGLRCDMQSESPFPRPVLLLRAEALCVLVACFGAYHLLFPHHWVLFACLFFVPDLSLLAYVRGQSAGASILYNVVHSYVLPAVVGLLALPLKSALLGEVSVIWIGHIAMDRMLGFGLKYPNSFQFTHIQSTANPLIPGGVDEPAVSLRERSLRSA